MVGVYVITILLSVVGFLVSTQLKSKFKKYSRFMLNSGLTGAEVAQKMLQHYGIQDVQIVMGQGLLTDHYNPLKKTVSLSPEVYQDNSIAAAAVAAHECGHAVQHAQAYSMLKLRSSLVPVVQVASQFQQYLLIIAFVVLSQFPALMLITIGTFVLTTLFSFVTLPVEFDASKRALVWLDQAGITTATEQAGAKDALKWAAMTYVSAALSSLVILVYLILAYAGRR